MLKSFTGVFAALTLALVTTPVWAQSTGAASQTKASVTTEQVEPSDAGGKVRYISDDLFAFLHAGPSRNYRILGSVVAGSPIQELQVSNDGTFVEVIDERQRTGWVEARFVQDSISLRARLPQLATELEALRQSLDEKSAQLEALNQQLHDIHSRNEVLLQQRDEQARLYQQAAKLLAEKDKSGQMDWFMRGAMVAFAGLIIGILITYLPKRRRRSEQWMS